MTQPIGSIYPQDIKLIRLLLEQATFLAKEGDAARLTPEATEELRSLCTKFLEASK